MSEQRAVVTSDLIITDRGGSNPRRVIGSNLACSWEVNLAGTLSASVPVNEVRTVGLDIDLRGLWLDYTHPSAGRWSGVITASRAVDGVIEVAAQGFAILTRKRLVSITGQKEQPMKGTPGGIFRLAFERMSNSGPTWLTLGDVDGSGPQIEVSYEYEDFYDSVAPALAGDNGFEWRVSNDRVVTFAQTIGVDRRASVQLIEGREILSGSSWTFDQWSLTNVLAATGIGRARKRVKKGKKSKFVDADYVAGPITVRDEASIAQYGILEELEDFGFVGDETVLTERATAALNASARGSEDAVELNVADVDGAFAKFAEGDTIAVTLGLAGISGTIRVMVRSLDVQTGVMAVAGLGARGT